MDPFARLAVSVLIVVVTSGITALVTSAVHRSSNRSSRESTVPGALFVVSSRGWQSRLLAGTGLLLIAVGLVLVVLAVAVGGSAAGAGIPGAVIALGGGVFLWLGWGVARARLEVTPDAVWAFRPGRTPREVPVREITRLTVLMSNRYGGVVARAGRERLFSATRLMLGYPQLIGHLHAQRPDLEIPVASRPM